MPWNNGAHGLSNCWEFIEGKENTKEGTVNDESIGCDEHSGKVHASLRGDEIYRPVLDYATWAKAIRQLKAGMAGATHGTLDKLAEVFELAASKVEDQASERTYLAHIMNVFLTATSRIPHDDLKSEQNIFLATLADELADTYEVLEFGDIREDKPHLPPRPILG
jgi:hypothetical protein